MIMSQSDAITDNDLDFFLTVISMFCEYNHTMHYSDRVFADITDNPGRTETDYPKTGRGRIYQGCTPYEFAIQVYY